MFQREEAGKKFFFEKKNQKTFTNPHQLSCNPSMNQHESLKAAPIPTSRSRIKKSFFASFCSQKEDSYFLSLHQI
jgi:hypothetical protein